MMGDDGSRVKTLSEDVFLNEMNLPLSFLSEISPSDIPSEVLLR